MRKKKSLSVKMLRKTPFFFGEKKKAKVSPIISQINLNIPSIMSHSAIHSLPHEITAKIFGYLPPKSLIHRFARYVHFAGCLIFIYNGSRASKSSAKLVQDVLSEGVAEHNSLNILVTGLPGAGKINI